MSTLNPNSVPEDLDSKSIQELLNIQKRAEELISQKQQEEVAKAVVEATRIAESVNLTLEELVEHAKIAPKRVRKSVEPRYRNTNNAAETWTGRGKQPNWLTKELAAGAKLEDFLI